jgi:uncharacterized protein (UPF0262 family)
MNAAASKGNQRLVKLTLDENSIGRSSADVEHERAVAIYDLLDNNSFAPVGHEGGPYGLHLAVVSNRLVLEVRTADEQALITHHLSLTSLKRIVKDYFMICDSYYAAIRTSTPSQIEAIDMGRRALHNEGSELLMERLKDKIVIDFDTARHLFTLVAVLHWKGEG